jgi:hypothetical protein
VAVPDLALVAVVCSDRAAVRWRVQSRAARWLVVLQGNSCTSTQVHSRAAAVAAFSGQAPATSRRTFRQLVPVPAAAVNRCGPAVAERASVRVAVVKAFGPVVVAKVFVPVAVAKAFVLEAVVKVGRARCRVGRGRVARELGPAVTIVRTDQTTDLDQIIVPVQITDLQRVLAKAAPANGGNPAIGPIIAQIESPIVTAGTTGETTIGPTSGTTGVTIGTTTGTTAITGGTTIGGITITGTIRTTPISITGAMPLGRA